MLLRTKGKPLNIARHIVGRVTRDPKNNGSDFLFILDHDSSVEFHASHFQAFLTTREIKDLNFQNTVHSIPNLTHIQEGDIVWVNEQGSVNTIYRINSKHNTLLSTERCNSNCLMCSQPPKDRNDVPLLYEVNKRLIPLIPKDCVELGMSGGEPTLMGDHFFDILAQISRELPDTEVHVLTNGRSFAWSHMAEKLASIGNNRIMLGIPVYSDYYQQHDYVVQAENAFNQTILGIHNLARYNQRIEIRIVLHKQTIPRLTKLARYIYKNLPFVEHVAFMGLEYIGYTPHNIDKLWIDPYDYQYELAESVSYLAGKGMHVSIYNTPLCTLPEHVWEFARKSISDWKNDYLEECQGCSKLNECGGFFRWNLKKHSEHIQPFSL